MNSPNRHMQILADCINCDLCVPECPTGAIDMGAQHCQVNAALCTLCEGYYLRPRCQSVCPVDVLIVVNVEQVFYVRN
jgi:ferredoxin